MLVTDLAAVDVADGRSPRQTGDDPALSVEGVEFDLVIARPAIFWRCAENRTWISRVSVFEREFSNAIPGERVDVVPHRGGAVDLSPRHYAGGPHFEVNGRSKEVFE